MVLMCSVSGVVVLFIMCVRKVWGLELVWGVVGVCGSGVGVGVRFCSVCCRLVLVMFFRCDNSLVCFLGLGVRLS